LRIAAISRYISETLQDSAKVTIECEYEVLAIYRMMTFSVT